MSNEALKIGDVIQDDPNAGWIYCEGEGIEPFLVAPTDSVLRMKWDVAVDYAKIRKSKLPTESQLDAMYVERNTGAFRNTFNLSGAGGTYFSAKGYGSDAWGQRFYTGEQVMVSKSVQMDVRLVRPYSIA